MKWFLDLSLGILAHLLRMVMKPKYFAFWRWLDAPIILWPGAWISRVWRLNTGRIFSHFWNAGCTVQVDPFQMILQYMERHFTNQGAKSDNFLKVTSKWDFVEFMKKSCGQSTYVCTNILTMKTAGKMLPPKKFCKFCGRWKAWPSPIVRYPKREYATGSTESIQIRLVMAGIWDGSFPFPLPCI